MNPHCLVALALADSAFANSLKYKTNCKSWMEKMGLENVRFIMNLANTKTVGRNNFKSDDQQFFFLDEVNLLAKEVVVLNLRWKTWDDSRFGVGGTIINSNLPTLICAMRKFTGWSSTSNFDLKAKKRLIFHRKSIPTSEYEAVYFLNSHF